MVLREKMEKLNKEVCLLGVFEVAENESAIIFAVSDYMSLLGPQNHFSDLFEIKRAIRMRV